MDKFILLFALTQFVNFFIWRYVNLILITSLEHFYKTTHKEAGSPNLSYIATPGKFNARWSAHILFLRFLKTEPKLPSLSGTFWVAFFSSWYLVLGLVLLLASFIR